MTFSADVFYSTGLSLSSFYVAMHNDLMASFGIFFRAAMTLYLAYVGYCFAMSQKGGGDATEIGKTFFLILIVYSFAFESTSYYDYVINPFFGLLEDTVSFFLAVSAKVSSAFSKPGGRDYFSNISTITDLFTGLDLMFLDFVKTCQDLIPSGWGMLNPGIILDLLLVFVLLAAYSTMYLAFCVVFIVSYFMMWLLLYLGGIMLLFGCIKETRGWLFGWCRMLANQFLTATLTALVVSVCYGGISSAVFKMTSYDASTLEFSGDFLQLMIWCVLCVVMTLKMQDLAASLTSSTPGSTAGMAGGISFAGGKGLAMGAFAAKAPAVAAGGAIQALGQKAGFIPTGMSATEALKKRIGLK